MWDKESRFGLDSSNVKVVRSAASVIRTLPPGLYCLGMHFHFAASAIGGERWFGLVKAFAVFCGEFAQLCGCRISTIDFGGGFDPHFLESNHAVAELAAHYSTATTRAKSANGKSITEDAGGVLTRILAIRERSKGKQHGFDRHRHNRSHRHHSASRKSVHLVKSRWC